MVSHPESIGAILVNQAKKKHMITKSSKTIYFKKKSRSSIWQMDCGYNMIATLVYCTAYVT